MIFLHQVMQRAKDTARGVHSHRSPIWPHVRAFHLAKFPACLACGSISRVEVHHVVPFHVAPSLELEPSNLVTLCDGPLKHHLTIGHLGSWRFINPSVREMADFVRENLLPFAKHV